MLFVLKCVFYQTPFKVRFLREQNYWYQTNSDCFVFRECFGSRGVGGKSEFTSSNKVFNLHLFLWEQERNHAKQSHIDEEEKQD